MTVESESPSARLAASTAQGSSAPRHEPLLISRFRKNSRVFPSGESDEERRERLCPRSFVRTKGTPRLYTLRAMRAGCTRFSLDLIQMLGPL